MIDIHVLGPIEVIVDAEVAPLRSGRQRALLAALVVHRGRPRSTDQLIDAIWGAEPPPSSVNTFHTHMSRLRAVLGKGAGAAIARLPTGYVLELERSQLDAARFEDLLDESFRAADEGQTTDAVAHLEEALALWRGPAFVDALDDLEVRAESVRLDDLRASATERLIDLKLELGQHRDLIGEIESLLQLHPLREHLWGQLMVALYRSERQVDAIRAFGRARQALSEVGVSPSQELVDLEQRILRQHLTLELSDGTKGSRVRNLPAELSSFVGRQAELGEIATQLGSQRLVTLTGIGGVGKTRLAIEASRRRGESLSGGAWFVSLADSARDADVAADIATILGVSGSYRDATRALVGHFAYGESLLVLDNCEHLLASTAPLVADLLSNCPGLSILATSRSRLGVTGEQVVPIPPMDVQPRDSGDDLPAGDALELFIDRAMRANPSFSPDGSKLNAIERICLRVDGLPLAIELAAARVSSLPVAEIVHRLDDRLALLAGNSRAVPRRQRTMAATLDWSYDLLTAGAQDFLQSLAEFRSGFTLDAAEAVWAAVARSDGGRADVVDLLSEVVNASLVVFDDAANPRYRLLEVVRRYALARLVSSGRRQVVRSHHADYFSGELKRAAIDTHSGGSVTEAIADLPNLRSAVDWLLEHDPRRGIESAIALEQILWTQGNIHEAYQVADLAVRRAADDSSRTVAEAHLWRARALRDTGDLEGATAAARDTRAMVDSLGDEELAGLVSAFEATLADYRGDYAQAAELYVRAVDVLRTVGGSALWVALFDLAHLFRKQGRTIEATEVYEDIRQYLPLFQGTTLDAGLDELKASIAIAEGELGAADRLLCSASDKARAIGAARSAESSDLIRAWVAYWQDDPSLSLELATSSQRSIQRGGNRIRGSEALELVGRLATDSGDLDVARRFLIASLRSSRAASDDLETTLELISVARLARASHRPSTATLLLSAATTSAATRGIHIVPAEQSLLDIEKKRLRQKLGGPEYLRLSVVGAALDLTEASHTALAWLESLDPPAAPDAPKPPVSQGVSTARPEGLEPPTF